MNTEILKISELLKDTYNGKPWFGKSITEILSEVNEDIVFDKKLQQHNIAEIVQHMINWRQFVLNRIWKNSSQGFEEKDWTLIKEENKKVWKEAIIQLQTTQTELVNLIERQIDSLLEDRVEGRDYNYRKLLQGIIQHDVYHLGQIACLNKLLKK